ncbi:DUF695 domain-containing protein [Flavihumibacter petaseus]|uniref:DUF695 domain-containing protein n=1 Tax=Flavihumibacter petaseus NBRC 106054 TaxID=1220578 RepID=A0A0E9N2Z4_9BACT|nr:DUF695 domain-containing protein [Flavihumibacter petaseus]GAO44199.1 hypothetical protein FPE01S_03_02370 [Flavihumibacter petaseus NBRC 106054]
MLKNLRGLFGPKLPAIRTYDDFWVWFAKNEQPFRESVTTGTAIEKVFFRKLAPALDQLNEGFHFLTGMSDENTVELIITADGEIGNFVFVEELVAAAPAIAGWKFTAHKPATEAFNLEMSGYTFSTDNMHFVAQQHEQYPDKIDITIIHEDYNESNVTEITRGVYIFLDNYLGELEFAMSIDWLEVAGPSASGEKIPLEKLKDYLTWREKEFMEKYDSVRRDTDNDNYTLMQGQLDNGKLLIAAINRDLLDWDAKASHPWALTVMISYFSTARNGMPGDDTLAELNDIEESISALLKDADGYLNIGRQTARNVREIYFACKEFRKPAKVITGKQKELAGRYKMTFSIRKDKYWEFVEHYHLK